MLKFSFTTVKLLSKSACSACDSGLFIIKKIKQKFPQVTYLKQDIEGEAQYLQYINKVPVVLIDQQPVCQMIINEAAIVNKLTELTKDKSS